MLIRVPALLLLQRCHQKKTDKNKKSIFFACTLKKIITFGLSLTIKLK